MGGMITAVKRSSLAELAEGWDEGCYAYVRPATVEDRRRFRELMQDEDKMMDFQHELVSSHFVSGKAKALNPETGEFELTDLTEEDLEIGVVNDQLAMDIMGFDLDPKAIGAAVTPSAAPEKSDPSTETS